MPLTAVVGYVLSILAALGAVTFVFQQGHLGSVFGIARPGPVLSFLPIEGNKLAETASQATPTESAASSHSPA